MWPEFLAIGTVAELARVQTTFDDALNLGEFSYRKKLLRHLLGASGQLLFRLGDCVGKIGSCDDLPSNRIAPGLTGAALPMTIEVDQ
jgi:hypothetical protein